jgi:hypothetical protein
VRIPGIIRVKSGLESQIKGIVKGYAEVENNWFKMKTRGGLCHKLKSHNKIS